MAATAIIGESVVDIIRQYIQELKEHGITIQEAILFSSYAKGIPKEDSNDE